MSVLALSLLPLIKGLKSPSSTDNYRLIAGTSLVLKIFENVILIIWGVGVQNDDLQFGFREKVGSSQCTWLIQETINYYLRGGSNPYLVSLDCTKAFPSCKWSVLFEELSKQLPAIVIRILMHSYINQQAYVKWGLEVSDTFEVSNGAAEGKVSSPLFWSL